MCVGSEGPDAEHDKVNDRDTAQEHCDDPIADANGLVFSFIGDLIFFHNKRRFLAVASIPEFF